MSNTDFEDDPVGEVEEQDEVEADGDDEAETEGPDTAEAADEGDGPDEVDDEPPRRGRANERIRTLQTRAQQEAERADRLARELSEEREARQRAQRTERESPAQLQERLALMTPEERSDYKMNAALSEMRREQAMNQVRMEDAADRTAFDAKAATDPLYAKWADKVEAARVNFMRTQGTLIPRTELLKWLVGESVIAARGKNSKQRDKGRETVRRQTVNAGNGKADARADRRASGDTPAKQLEGVII